MICLVHSQPGVRLGNYLYLILNCFKRNNNEIYKVGVRNESCYRELSELNLSDLIVNVSNNNYPRGCIWTSEYYQNCNIDFNRKLLNSFISSTIAESNIFKQKEPIEDRVSIHIRLGDYLKKRNRNYYGIDGNRFLNSACSELSVCSDTIDVYSDSIGFCKSKYSDILEKYFKVVNYISNSVIDDFVSLCFYKYKILWNSTFGYWTGYVSDYIFDGGKQNIIITPNFQTLLIYDGRPISVMYNWKKVDCRQDLK